MALLRDDIPPVHHFKPFKKGDPDVDLRRRKTARDEQNSAPQKATPVRPEQYRLPFCPRASQR